MQKWVKRRDTFWLLEAWVYWVACLWEKSSNEVLQELSKLVLGGTVDNRQKNEDKKSGRFFVRKETVEISYETTKEGCAIFQYVWFLLDILLLKKNEGRINYVRFIAPYSERLESAMDVCRSTWKVFALTNKNFKPPLLHWQTKRRIEKCLKVIVELIEVCPQTVSLEKWLATLATIVFVMLKEIEDERCYGINELDKCLTKASFYPAEKEECSKEELELRRLALVVLKKYFFPYCLRLPCVPLVRL